MKYTKEQRLDIGRRIYDGEIDCYQAAEEYSINQYTARDYMRLYRDTYQLPKRLAATHTCKSFSIPSAANNQPSKSARVPGHDQRGIDPGSYSSTNY